MQAISVDYLIAQQERANHFDRLQPGLRAELARVNAALHARNQRNEFYASLSEALNRWGSLTERQTAALKRSLARDLDRTAAPVVLSAPIPTGRVLIVGTVKSTKFVDNDFGGSFKMLVQSDAGWRVWGTVPAVLGDVAVGTRISFVAAVTPKDREFGFFSRPAQARKLDAAPVTEVERAPEPAPAVPVVAQEVAAAKPVAAPKLADIIAQLKAKA
jgi:hypothetical protein